MLRVRAPSTTPVDKPALLIYNVFMFKDKGLVLGVLATILILVGGVFLFGKSGSSVTSGSKVSDEILTPAGVEKTGGFVNGNYLPASSTATVTLVEFGDYQCPACGAYHPLVKRLLTDFSGKINFVFRDFPLSQHANASITSNAVEAAGLQGKYWQMHDKIYENQSEWSNSTDAMTILIGYAKNLGLNVEQFGKDIDSPAVKDKVQKGISDGNLAGINATPTFFVNGLKLDNPGSYDEFKKTIQQALDKSKISQTPSAAAYHVHFDLKVYLNGSPVNFALSKYQESKTNPLDANIHFHDGNGKVVHVHKAGVALKELFDSFKLAIPAGSVAYVNGKKVEDILNYVPQDLDQILIGSSNLTSVSKDACVYSLKCPERGTPPPEDCVGGLGTGCSD